MSDRAPTVAGVPELVDVLEIAAVGTAEAALVGDGSCIPPTVHMISDLPTSPYVGYVMSRPFCRGDDAATAISTMGALPAAVRACRLVLAWEHSDLHVALETPGDAALSAVMVVDADASGHEVRWHPFDVTVGAPTASGAPTIVPTWGLSRRERDGALPRPIAQLLATWRAGGDPRELRWLHGRMEREGYTVHWMTRKAPQAHVAR